MQISGKVGSREPRRPDTYISMVSLAGRHCIMCQYVFALYIVFGLRSVITTALDSDESLHSEVGLRQERESTSDLDIIQSAYGRTNCLKRRRQREKALRSGESADKRLERLQRRR